MPPLPTVPEQDARRGALDDKLARIRRLTPEEWAEKDRLDRAFDLRARRLPARIDRHRARLAQLQALAGE